MTLRSAALATIGLGALAVGCGPPESVLVGGWSCRAVGVDGRALPPSRSDLPRTAFGPTRGLRYRACERRIEVPADDPALTTEFAGRLPTGTVAVAIDGETIVSAGAPHHGVLVHPLPARLAGSRTLLIETRYHPPGSVVPWIEPRLWRVGSRDEVERAVMSHVVGELALSLLLALVGIAYAIGAVFLWRKARAESLLLASIAGFALSFAFVRFSDNPLHPLFGVPVLALWPLRAPIGPLIVAFELDAFVRLSAPPFQRALRWIPLVPVIAALARVASNSTFVVIATNYVIFLAVVVLLLCAIGLLRRRRSTDWVPLVASVVLFVGMSTRIASLGGAGSPDFVLYATYVAIVLVAIGALQHVSVRIRQLSNLEALARYVPSQLFRHAELSDAPLVPAHARRHLTVFFSDLVGFTPLGDRLAPEALAAALGTYLTRMAAIAEAHGGVIDKFVGDAVMVWFGGIDPDDDPKGDAIRCVRMAIEMLRALTAVNSELADRLPAPLQIRAGINSGQAMVGDFGSSQRSDFTAVGREVNVAARLESSGVAGKLQISRATYELVSDAFTCEPRGEMQLKGLSESIETWLVSADVEHADDRARSAERNRRTSA